MSEKKSSAKKVNQKQASPKKTSLPIVASDKVEDNTNSFINSGLYHDFHNMIKSSQGLLQNNLKFLSDSFYDFSNSLENVLAKNMDQFNGYLNMKNELLNDFMSCLTYQDFSKFSQKSFDAKSKMTQQIFNNNCNICSEFCQKQQNNLQKLMNKCYN